MSLELRINRCPLSQRKKKKELRTRLIKNSKKRKKEEENCESSNLKNRFKRVLCVFFYFFNFKTYTPYKYQSLKSYALFKNYFSNFKCHITIQNNKNIYYNHLLNLFLQIL